MILTILHVGWTLFNIQYIESAGTYCFYMQVGGEARACFDIMLIMNTMFIKHNVSGSSDQRTWCDFMFQVSCRMYCYCYMCLELWRVITRRISTLTFKTRPGLWYTDQLKTRNRLDNVDSGNENTPCFPTNKSFLESLTARQQGNSPVCIYECESEQHKDTSHNRNVLCHWPNYREVTYCICRTLTAT